MGNFNFFLKMTRFNVVFLLAIIVFAQLCEAGCCTSSPETKGTELQLYSKQEVDYNVDWMKIQKLAEQRQQETDTAQAIFKNREKLQEYQEEEIEQQLEDKKK